ncbi:MAG TPA: efflux RND transporter periplasmic adaptor subunit [Polyangiaceae bacterium]|jgi:RND family efflux transporter MFP subunit
MTSSPTVSQPTPPPSPPAHARRGARIPIVIGAGVALVLVAGAVLIHRAESHVNDVPLSAAPKPVTVVEAQDTRFREQRVYIGTLRPWIEAQVGPQFISAYVDTVLVRPGAVVKRGEVLATLDCRNASAASQAVAAEARAIDEQQKAVADEATRMESLLDGGYIDPNSVQLKKADSSARQAQLAAQRAKLASSSLAVDDCVLRAPFDGEVATRTIDPGAFVRPGTSIVSVVDRSTVRMTIDVPEDDFGVVAPQTVLSVHLLATGKTLPATISRRSPSADPDTRTVHVEIDMPDPKREIPVNTTGEARVEVGEPRPATAIPLDSAAISGSKAALFVVAGGVAHKARFHVQGERGGTLFVDTDLKPGTQVVTEGRAILADGDRVAPREVAFSAASASASPSAKEPGK